MAALSAERLWGRWFVCHASGRGSSWFRLPWWLDTSQFRNLQHHTPAHLSIKRLFRPLPRFPIEGERRPKPHRQRSHTGPRCARRQHVIGPSNVNGNHRTSGLCDHKADSWFSRSQLPGETSSALRVNDHRLSLANEVDRQFESFSIQPIRADRNPAQGPNQGPEP